MKSIISDHTATSEEVLTQLNSVVTCGELTGERKILNTTIKTYCLGNLIYIITIVHGELITFELSGIYCFKF